MSPIIVVQIVDYKSLRHVIKLTVAAIDVVVKILNCVSRAIYPASLLVRYSFPCFVSAVVFFAEKCGSH